MRTLVLLVLALLPNLARADQCALNSATTAEAAAKLVPPGSRVLEFCEPCRERAPGTPYIVKTVAVRGGELLVNGSAVDLAYLFVETSKTEYKNVGVATGCGASRVSAYIRDGKPGGLVAGARQATPRPPQPPTSLPRATAAADLAGTWTVKLAPSLTSCPAKPSGPDETWWIDVQADKIAISTSGTLAFAGPASSLTHGSFQHSLQARQAASGAVLKLSHSFRDKLWGTLVVGTPTGNPSDPVCVTQFNLSGNRQP